MKELKQRCIPLHLVFHLNHDCLDPTMLILFLFFLKKNPFSFRSIEGKHIRTFTPMCSPDVIASGCLKPPLHIIRHDLNLAAQPCQLPWTNSPTKSLPLFWASSLLQFSLSLYSKAASTLSLSLSPSLMVLGHLSVYYDYQRTHGLSKSQTTTHTHSKQQNE